MADKKDISDIFASFNKSEEEKKEETESTESKEEVKEPEEKETETKTEEKPAEEEKKEQEPEKEPETKEEKKEEPKKEEPKKEDKTTDLPFLKKKTPSTNEVPVAKKKDDEFDLSPASPNPKHIILVYGLKGSGKTTLSFSFPKTHQCLCFDNKAVAIAEQTDKKDSILVFDGSRYMDETSPDNMLESSDRTWRYINKLLDTIEEPPDWIMVDGGELFHTTAEMIMRYRNNLMPFQGIQNRNLWKERRMYIDQLLRKCIQKSKKGVIWSSYIEKDEIIRDGEFVTKADVPKYISAVMRETDVVIKVERETDKAGQKFFATIETSKWPLLPETPRTEITGKGIKALAKGDL